MSATETTTTIYEPLARAVLRDIAKSMNAKEARWVVDYYYSVQDYRIQAEGQARSVEQMFDEAPSLLAEELGARRKETETLIRYSIQKYEEGALPGRWALSITGIGPVIAAGLLAHIDIRKSPTAGHIWRFAGLDPSVTWHGSKDVREITQRAREAEETDWDAFVWLCRSFNMRPGEVLKNAKLVDKTLSVKKAMQIAKRLGGDLAAAEIVEFEGDNVLLRAFPHGGGYAFETGYKDVKLDWQALTSALSKRPWNAKLKVLCWKIGDSFVKNKSRESDIYGQVYQTRKEQEVAKNENGDFADQATRALTERNIKDKELKACYGAGKLPPGRLDLRARRYAVKLFLAHLHHVMYEDHFGKEPPKPYVMSLPGHAHFIAPPKWPMD